MNRRCWRQENKKRLNLIGAIKLSAKSRHDAKTKHGANVLLQNLLKCESILAIFTCLYIFSAWRLADSFRKKVEGTGNNS